MELEPPLQPKSVPPYNDLIQRLHSDELISNEPSKTSYVDEVPMITKRRTGFRTVGHSWYLTLPQQPLHIRIYKSLLRVFRKN